MQVQAYRIIVNTLGSYLHKLQLVTLLHMQKLKYHQIYNIGNG